MVWIIYFWGYSLLLGYAYYILFRGNPVVWDWLDVPLSVVGMLGVVGFAYKINPLTPSFWKGWLWVIIAWDVTYNLLLTRLWGKAQHIEAEPRRQAWDIGIWFIVIPKYVALFLYSYKSSALWNSNVQTTGMD